MSEQDEKRDEAPGGLLGLILWPLQAAISAGLGLFAALIAGIFGALLPGSKDDEADKSGE